jgi:hypothetical protein
VITRLIFHMDVRPCPCFSDTNSSWRVNPKTHVFEITCKTCKTTVYSQEHMHCTAIITSESPEPAQAKPAVMQPSQEPLRGLDGKPLFGSSS